MVSKTKIKITISLDDDVLRLFKEECEKNGMKVSPRINVLIRESLKNRSILDYS